MRQAMKQLVRAAGLERPARGVITAWRRRSRRYARGWRDDEHLRLLLAFSLPAEANCVDVGAADGKVLTDIVRVAPFGRHIAYEPLPSFYTALVSRFPQVDLRPAALSNVDGETTFTYVRDAPWYSGFRQRDYPAGVKKLETIVVRTERLDDHLPDGYVPHFIKIDVEGAEKLVLEGALDTISRYKPIVVFEHGRGSSEYYGATPTDIFRILHDEAGLRIFNLDAGGPYTLDQFQLAYDTNSHFNFVARR